MEFTVVGWALFLADAADRRASGARAVAVGGCRSVARSLTLHEAEGFVGGHDA